MTIDYASDLYKPKAIVFSDIHISDKIKMFELYILDKDKLEGMKF